MIKSNYVKLIYRICAVIIGIIGIYISIGINSLYYFTNLSNYACFIYLVVDLIYVIYQLSKGEKEGNKTICSTLKFCLVIAIMLTFIVADFILFNIFTPAFWQGEVFLTNLFLHFGMPLLFMIDYFLFNRHHTLRLYSPFLSLILPYIYVSFILIRAEVVGRTSDNFLYPYFFVNVNEIGYGGVFLWIVGLSLFFIGIGYLIYFIDSRNLSNEKEGI